MRSIKKVFGVLFALFAAPLTVLAQVTDVFDLQILIYNILVAVGGFAWVGSVAFFLWGVVKFISNANDETEREKGKQFIIWGIIAFVVLISLWGIVRILLVETLGITPGGALDFIDKGGVVH